MSDVPLRAGDADRDAVVDRLRAALVDGRLDESEFDERLEAASRARTLPELAALTRDLPGEGLLPAPVPLRDLAVPARPGRSAVLREVSTELVGWASVFAICNVVWLLTGAGAWWPGWLLIALVVVVRRALR